MRAVLADPAKQPFRFLEATGVDESLGALAPQHEQVARRPTSAAAELREPVG
ncbi:hypothetical protein [Amycolatopsis sp. lyj-109]|uniref:hypothetical protein n=1 Tax=Amycolatopsis sp. lyj-109 TaxID=2789287 RepID=UPI00397CF06E